MTQLRLPPTRPPIGVLLMAHGTPSALDQMREYLTVVRGGRPPSEALVDEMRHHYAAIGGRSPLTEITLRQQAALQDLLGASALVRIGMRNWHPFIADAVAHLQESGVRHVIGIPLAPQFSTLSVQKYVEAARAAIGPGVTFNCVTSFHDHPLLLEAFAERVRAARAGHEHEDVIFTAHSLPVAVLRAGDPYAREVAATAAGVAGRCGLTRHHVAYQSAGRTSEPWQGPDVSEVIRACASRGVRDVLVVPIGFVCDHTEILFDIDVEAAAVARESSVRLRRVESLNTSPLFIRLLAALVHERVRSGQQSAVSGQ